MSSSTKWFLVILGIVLVTGLLITVAFVSMVGNMSGGGTETVTTGSGDKIGVVELTGVITSSEEFVRQVKKFREQSSIRAILIRVDSPGGGVVASQEMYEEVRKTRESGKPVVVSMGALAASGGYYVACGATRLVANRGTLTGSIGVISEFLQMHELLGKVGVDVKTIKAGALKDAGSSTRPMTDKDQRYFQALMDDVHRQFISVVADERGFDSTYVRQLADGRVYTGEQAVEAGLVDTIGTYEDAIQITADLAGIEGEPSLVREKKRRTWLESMTGDVSEQVRAATQELMSWPVMSFRFTGR